MWHDGAWHDPRHHPLAPLTQVGVADGRYSELFLQPSLAPASWIMVEPFPNTHLRHRASLDRYDEKYDGMFDQGVEHGSITGPGPGTGSSPSQLTSAARLGADTSSTESVQRTKLSLPTHAPSSTSHDLSWARRGIGDRTRVMYFEGLSTDQHVLRRIPRDSVSLLNPDALHTSVAIPKLPITGSCAQYPMSAAS